MLVIVLENARQDSVGGSPSGYWKFAPVSNVGNYSVKVRDDIWEHVTAGISEKGMP